MENKNSVTVSCTGFCGMLTIVFIILKLCGVIAWSWLWVLAPIWIPTALVLTVIGLIFLYAFISVLIDKSNK